MSYKQDLIQINGELQEVLETTNNLPTIDSLTGTPVTVSTADAMTAILSGATALDVGKVYRYTGLTTDTYKFGHLYIIAEEAIE